MKMRFLHGGVVLYASLLVAAGPARAENLLGAYHQAVAHDPVLAQARAELAEDRAGLPVARSALYPHVRVAASVGVNRAEATGIGLPILANYRSDSYGIILTQPLMNSPAAKPLTQL